ncbi:MAG: NUDIX domain-containing protein [Verrucomicrobiota bacterium]|nr:NUDIX domain-containing protein [Verrucomicrobiota bacterium]
MAIALPFKISVLVFIQNDTNKHLLIKRSKAPNKGCWSPIGGKLEMHHGESPYECARRETLEEIGLRLVDSDLHCFGYISEKSYEGTGHWLMFLFNCKKKINQLPREIEEGRFAFFSRSEIASLSIPKTDRMLLWPYFDKYSNAFVGIRANCAPSGNLDIVEELQLPQLKGTV